MKIASYNIWNCKQGRPERDEQIIRAIELIDADVIGLQEVSEAVWHKLSQIQNYTYKIYKQYSSEDEGLAFLSRMPIVSHSFLHGDRAYSCDALNVVLECEGRDFSLTNVHLSWNSAISREQGIVSVNQFIQTQKNDVDYCVLLGDFNCGYESSVHEFLVGSRTVDGQEAKPYWYDLASAYSAMTNTDIVPTLDFHKNPRWKNEGNLATPFVADRIYFLNPYPKDEPKLKSYTLFGTEVSDETLLSPSDHYGVCAEIELNKITR